MDAKFSPRVREVMSLAKEEAVRMGNSQIGPEHFLMGLLREGQGSAIRTLKSLDVNLSQLKRVIEDTARNYASTNIANVNNIPLNKAAEKALKVTYLEARSYAADVIGTDHLMLAILRDENSTATQILTQFNVDYNRFKDELENPNPNEVHDELPPMGNEDDDIAPQREERRGSETGKAGATKSKTPVLDNFGRDLTKLAEDGKLDPIVGREKEIERVSQILSRRKKNNPVLIGEPGVGKTAIAEGLALRIVQRKVSRILYNKRIVMLDLASLVAGTKYRGQFEERMKAVMQELEKSPDVIVFIDEIHTLVGAGGASGSLDASNMFKPALARGEIQCIGATTLNEYRQYIEKDGALERRFQQVIINPSSPEETIEILHNIKDKYEDHHNVTYTEEAIDACVSMSVRYLTDRHLPDKAIDVMDEVGARVHISNIHVPPAILELEKQVEEIKNEKNRVVKSQRYEEAAQLRDKEKNMLEQLEIAKRNWEEESKANRYQVVEEDVADVIAMITGIPVKRIAQSEGNKLLSMSDEMRAKVIGQDEAVKKLAKAIQRNRAGLKDPNKPIGSFIFLGPTGVGKTEMSKILSEYLFESKDSLIRIDMSEYMEKFAVSRLVGAPPGYVGYEEGGQLTEKVRRKPYAVILLDEIEKAHPEVFNILLQVLDEGFLTDSLGRKVDFRNTIIIMTSNIGSRQIKDFGQGVGFSTQARTESSLRDTKGIIENALKRFFSPEFLNRVDDVIVFDSLNKESIIKILDLSINKMLARIEKLGLKIKVTDAAKEFLADKGFDPEYGARPLARALQKYLEDPIAEEILKAGTNEGDTVDVDHEKGEEELRIKLKKAKKKKEDINDSVKG
jgi:ATP-dependent Clp protease ATP-binding subunit ClpC